MSAALMSIKPRFAEAILAGDKTIELRRRRPRLAPGSRVSIYASSPVQAVVGWFEVGTVIEANPVKLWRLVGQAAAVTRTEFDDYFAGRPLGYGIEIVNVGTTDAIPLGIHPPQSWQYLREAVKAHRALIALQGAN
jgi:predicted transcriptional regulator